MKKAKQEQDNSLFFMQFMMNALILPPSEFFNGDILNMILNDNGSEEEMELRVELDGISPKLFQQKIEEILPSFQLEYDQEVKKLLDFVQPSIIIS